MTDTVTTYIYAIGAKRWYDIFSARSDEGKVYITDVPRKDESNLVLTIALTQKQYMTITRELGHSRDFNGEFVAENVDIFMATLKSMGIYTKSHTNIYQIARNISTHKNYSNKCELMAPGVVIVSTTLR